MEHKPVYAELAAGWCHRANRDSGPPRSWKQVPSIAKSNLTMQSEILRRNGQRAEPTNRTDGNHSEQRSAISTPAGDQNAPYARLLGEFRHSSFRLTQLKRAHAVAIYQQTKNEQAPAFEVVIVRRREASFAFGKDFPATVSSGFP
jgi:hypothetical protein